MGVPSFYCENCGREVASNLVSCPGCGQKFYSVRCPSCGFTGAFELFKLNCPVCGYTGAGITDKNPEGRPNKPDIDASTENNRPRKQFSPWFYKVLIGILVVLIVILIRAYFLL